MAGATGTGPGAGHTADRNDDVTAPAPGATYVYGVVAAGTTPETLPDSGLGEVRTITVDGLAALVTDVNPAELHGRRRELAAHTRVLDAALAYGPVLPMHFGTLLSDEDAVVTELLVGRADLLAQRLGEVSGHVQMSVRVVLDEQAVLAHVVRSDPRLAQLAARQQSGTASRAQQLRLGEAVAKAYQRFATELSRQLLPSLGAHAQEHVLETARSRDDALVAAFLVADADVDRFLADAEGVGEALDGLARVRVTGPMPVYAFVPAEAGTPAAAWA